MPSALDRFMPKTRFQFLDASNLSAGTVSREDQIHRAVCLSYTPAGSETPSMELELPPKTVEAIIRHLQERANEARFVNGEKMLDYPKPVPVKPPGAKPSRPRRDATKKAVERPPANDARPPATP